MRLRCLKANSYAIAKDHRYFSYLVHMKYYMIAGEASGDLHGSNLIKRLKTEDEQAVIRCWGGDLMEVAGGTLVKHYRDLAFMGFVEVVKNLRTILYNIKFCKKDIEHFDPDALILIDYPGFNLRIAEWAKQTGYRVFYYVSPQIWAWHSSRIHKIKRVIDRLYVILPFEADFYKKYNYEVEFHGHPLVDVIVPHEASPDFLDRNKLPDLPIIALLPGSRRQEIDRLLQVMLSVVPYFEGFQFVIAAASATPIYIYEQILVQHGFDQHPPCSIVQHQTYDLLQHAQAALVTSGTATLETALFNVPQVVCYKTSFLTYQIAKRLVNISYISLVNLIADKAVVKELIQADCNTKTLSAELEKILDGEARAEILDDYQKLREQLGSVGVAQRIAKSITGHMRNDFDSTKF